MSEGEIKKIFSKNLCYYLNINNKTQADLVKYIGISSSTVSNWCTGQKMPRADKIQSIANWFGIKMGDLLQEKNIMSFSSKAESSPEILKFYNALNDFGKKEAEKRVQELTYIPFYCSDTNSTDADKNSKFIVPELFAASAEDRSPEKIALMESEFDDFDDI